MDAWSTKHGKYVKAHRPSALRDKAIILVLLDTGIRASELCDLRIQDYDKKRGQLTVHHGKGNKRRDLYLGDTARQAVWRYLTSRSKPMPDEFLFATRDGHRLDRGNVLHIIERAGERAGVPNAGLHRFRHTFAINYLRNGGSVLALQQMLGHERLETVRIYARLASVDLERTQRQASPADNWRL